MFFSSHWLNEQMIGSETGGGVSSWVLTSFAVWVKSVSQLLRATESWAVILALLYLDVKKLLRKCLTNTLNLYLKSPEVCMDGIMGA